MESEPTDTDTIEAPPSVEESLNTLTLPHAYRTREVPMCVDLVALGESARVDYHRHALVKGAAREAEQPHEVWTVNRGLMLYAADVCFILDELTTEAAEDPRYRAAIERAAYSSAGRPRIVTTRCGDYAASPNVYPYPAQAIMLAHLLNPETDDPYWHNSIPMIVAYASAIGVRRMRIWGADYTMPDGRVLEDDRANLEYWCGRAAARGMKIGIPPSSTLMSTNRTRGLRVYGLRSHSEEDHRAWLTSGAVRLDR